MRGADPAGGAEVEGVERTHAGLLGDRRSELARRFVELDDRDVCKVVCERSACRGRGGGLEQASEVAADFDRR